MKLLTETDSPFVVVVTGSSSGIGQAIATEFAARGAHVLIHARSNLHGLMMTSRSARDQISNPEPSSRVRAMVADLRSPASQWECVRAGFSWFGHVNVWVHAAGADVLTGEADRWSFQEKLQQLWETDVQGTMLLSRRVAVAMQQHPVPHAILPSIVHIGWDQAEQGMEGDSGQYFSAVKAAVAAFSKSLAKSAAPNVRVNCVAPGWIQTDWGRTVSGAWDERARNESLLKRWGTPSDVARFVAAISMGDGEFINGQTLDVNGGWCGNADRVHSRSSRDPRPTLDSR